MKIHGVCNPLQFVASTLCIFILLFLGVSVTGFQAVRTSSHTAAGSASSLSNRHPVAPTPRVLPSSSPFFTVSRSSHVSLNAVEVDHDEQSSAPVDDLPPNISEWPTPPKKKGFLRRFRDTFGMIKNPNEFILQRSRELESPVFEMYQFFQPIVVVGGQEAVQEFITHAESKYEVIHPALPEPFLELHTKWGALNLDSNDIVFQQARAMFGDVLPPRYHVPDLVPQIEAYVDQLAERVRAEPTAAVYLVPELIRLCLNMFATNFSGKPLTEKQIQQFIDYNSGLISLGKQSKQFKAAQAALQDLQEEMLTRFRDLESAPNDAPGKSFYKALVGRENFPDDRISTSMVLFIWAGYVETASLMVDSLALMDKYDIPVDQVYSEYVRAQQQQQLQQDSTKTDVTRPRTEKDASFWNLPYTTGILRETLRLEAPGAGVQRYSEQDFPLAGYRIPARMQVIMDPRLGNADPNLFEEPERFEPLRWVPKAKLDQISSSGNNSKCPFAGTAMTLGPGSWFPGGNGAHKCPGIPLAETTATIFLSKMSQRFSDWTASGSGLTADGKDINYVQIPIKICPDDFGLILTLREEEAAVAEE